MYSIDAQKQKLREWADACLEPGQTIENYEFDPLSLSCRFRICQKINGQNFELAEGQFNLGYTDEIARAKQQIIRTAADTTLAE